MTDKTKIENPTFEDVVESSPEFRKKYREMNDKFWKKEDPEFYELMKKVRKNGADKETD